MVTFYYLCVDFESCDAVGTWIAFAAGIFEHPGGRVVDRLERSIVRPMGRFDHIRKSFWLGRNRAAYDWMIANAVGGEECVNACEEELCRFVRNAHMRYHQLRVISDHPSFDLRLMDNMLAAHSYPPCTQRESGAWHHPLCTYSFALGVGHPHERPVWADGELPHTPWSDVKRIVTDHFRVLDAV